MLPYAVVEFLNAIEVDIVCSNWLFDEETKAYWPNKNISKCQKKQTLPSEDWTVHDVRILGRAISYEEARRMLKRSEFTSDVKSDSGKRKQKKRREFFSSSSEDDEEYSRPAKIATYFTPKTLLQNSTSTKTSRPFSLHLRPGPSNSQGEKSTSRGENDFITKAEFKAFQEKHFEMISELKVSLDNLVDSVKKISAAVVTPVIQPLPDSSPNLPLRSEGDLMEMEQWLFNSDNKVLLVNYLALLGGKNVEDATRKILSHVLSKEFAMSLNWAGRNDKIGFSALKLKDVVIGAALNFSAREKENTISKVEEAIKLWLKSARYRIGKKNVPY